MKKRDRKKARNAYYHLIASKVSSYTDFVAEHETFLEKHPDADERVRRRPLRFIEREGLENALWPHLYWSRNLCETVVRAHDARRRAAKYTGLDESDSEGDDLDDSDDDETDVKLKEGRQSIRKNFLKKVLSPVVGYSEDYNLLHFVYDLCLWTGLGGCKNSAKGISLQLALKGSPIFPEYWRVRHQALIDLQRQVGPPHLFRTRAPYEKTFPYHHWVLDEMTKCGRGRQQLAGPETLHMAHVLKEMDRGFFTGKNHQKWKHHLLAAVDDPEVATVTNFCSRLEFQDGKRKTGTQRYHGRGTCHSHSLDFLQNVDKIQLETKMAATIPPEEDALLRGLVLDGQQDRTRSNVAPREEPSAWDDDNQRVLLHHSEDDYQHHVRPYFPESMEVTKCHEDAQMSNGRQNLLRYVATYTPKFSGSMAKDWLDDHASDYSVARRVAFSYHPLEPEMWLSLAGQLFPQISFGGTLHPMVAPFPGMTDKPAFVQIYENSEWRREDMPLVEFLRKSNKEGAIIHFIKRLHKKSDTAEDDLEEFANGYTMQGEKLLAVAMVSRLRDLYYGQWMAMNMAYRDLDDLLIKKIVDKVPDRYKYFACAWQLATEYWEDEDAIRKDMELEAYGDDHITTVLNMIRAQMHLVGRYLYVVNWHLAKRLIWARQRMWPQTLRQTMAAGMRRCTWMCSSCS